ncbi:MAG TPA: nucleotidyltransferase domain-containing protein [Gammaproteobacteria bacterium]|nr:nucleotidyltransferase domain-containing protein [Gammaproteobacteria bacterium]
MPQKPLLDEVSDVLSSQEDIVVGIAFGSLAAGRAGPHSDIDIAVLGRLAPLGSRRKAELIRDLAAVTGRPVDLIDLRTAGVAVRRAAIRGGRRLVCKDRRAYDALVSKMMTDAEDFLPYRERMLRERLRAWTR